MPVSKARKKASKHNGSRKNAGRSAVVRPIISSQDMALRLMGRALLIVSVAVLASSTLSDPLQKLTEAGMAESMRVGSMQNFTSWQQQERLALLRRVAGDAGAVRHLTASELTSLFGAPGLKREEAGSHSWHFTSNDCALDVYFRNGTPTPVYAEYRVRDAAQETGLVDAKTHLDHKTCVKSLFSHARF